MNTPDGHLVRTAFLTKYGYSTDLTYPQILREFQKRYDYAQALRLQNAGAQTIMLVIEGMAETAAKEEASAEREVRRRQIERLSEASDYGLTELDQMIEVFAQRLEVEWIQSI